MITRLAMVGLVGMAGCGPVVNSNTGAATPAVGDDTCNAAAYVGLIGQDAVNTLQIPDPKRSYRPDEAITQDFNPARVNILLDDTDTITAIRCG